MSSQLVRQARRLLLRVIIVSIGFWTIPVQAQVSNTQVGALVEALRLAAPQTGTENDGLYSEWQIKPENIPRWSQQCISRQLTPTEFESSPVTARAILVCVMREVLEQQYLASGNNESIAVQRAAAWWMTGDASSYNSHPANSFTHSYIQKVLSFYQEQKGNAQTQPTPTPTLQPTVTPPQLAPSSPAQPTPQTSATTQITDAQVGTLVEALRLAAPQTGTENDGLYSEWQIKPENIPRWSQQCISRQLTPTEFESSPVTARAILVCVMRDVLAQQYSASGNNESIAVQRAAAWWMTGDASSYNSHPANSFTHSYIQKVLSLYQQQKGNTQAPATPTPPSLPDQTTSTSPPQSTTTSSETTVNQPQTTNTPPQPTASNSSPAPISNAQVLALVEALRLAAPQTGTENNGLYSDWQIKPEKISLWSQRCMGREVTPEDFAANPATARTILLCVMGDVFRQQYNVSKNNELVAVQRTAAWWLTGDPEQYDSDATAAYAQRVLDLYRN